MKRMTTVGWDPAFQNEFAVLEGLKEGNICYNTGFISWCSAEN